jgi:uncharacterized protein (UPF0333 family)
MKLKFSKAQTSFEFLLMVVIGISILVPIIGYVSLYEVSYRDAYKISMAKDAVDKLGEAAESIYIQGYPAKMSLTISVPEGVHSSLVDKETIMFSLSTSSGQTDIYSNPKANVTGTLPIGAGYHKIMISNERTFIKIIEGS